MNNSPEAESKIFCEKCREKSGSIRGFNIVPNAPEFKNLLNEIFCDEYIQSHSNFGSFQAFKYSSAVIVDWDHDPLIYSKSMLDSFVKESTQFSTWDEMVIDATNAFTSKYK